MTALDTQSTSAWSAPESLREATSPRTHEGITPARGERRGVARPTGLRWLLAAELGASLLGFAVVVRWARWLGLASFAHVEYASAVAAWVLVLVRSGVEVIVYREAARRPRLIGPMTDILLGLKCAGAAVGYAAVVAIAVLVGPERGSVVALAGLVLVPSALVVDVGPRALGQLRWLALAQALRAVGHAAMGTLLVWAPGHAARAALCGVIAEAVGWLVPFVLHVQRYGVPRPRYKRRAWAVLAQRAAIASLTRFGRVSLYGADVLVLGWWAGAELGRYAAARRVVFGLVALGLVVPGAVGPAIAAAWLQGAQRARAVIQEMSVALWRLALPAAVGLALTAERTMPLLFGSSYRLGAPWLVLVAARLPWLLSGSFAQAALVACRRESAALRLVLGMLLLAAFVLPAAAYYGGPWAVACAALVLEGIGSAGGWVLLRREGLAPVWSRQTEAIVLGCLVMTCCCQIAGNAHLGIVCLVGIIAYFSTLAIYRSRSVALGRPEETQA